MPWTGPCTVPSSSRWNEKMAGAARLPIPASLELMFKGRFQLTALAFDFAEE